MSSMEGFEGQYGQLEAQIGQDAYQSNIGLQDAQADAVRSQAEHNRKQIECMETQRTNQMMMAIAHAKLRDSFASILFVISVGLVPVFVMFWVYLFKQWVI